MDWKDEKDGATRFCDAEPTMVGYRGREYRTWEVFVPEADRTVRFAEEALNDEIGRHGDYDCPQDTEVAYYVDPTARIADAIEAYLN